MKRKIIFTVIATIGLGMATWATQAPKQIVPEHKCCHNGQCCATEKCCDKKGCNSTKCPLIKKDKKDKKQS